MASFISCNAVGACHQGRHTMVDTMLGHKTLSLSSHASPLDANHANHGSSRQTGAHTEKALCRELQRRRRQSGPYFSVQIRLSNPIFSMLVSVPNIAAGVCAAGVTPGIASIIARRRCNSTIAVPAASIAWRTVNVVTRRMSDTCADLVRGRE